MNPFYIGVAIVCVLLAVAGYFFFLSVKNLIEIKRIKFQFVKPEYLKKKVYPMFWIKVFSSGLAFLFFLHIYCGLLK